MNPFLMQQDVPKIPELWKNEVNKYRLWIILFFIGVTIIATLSLISIILSATGMTEGVIKQYMNSYNKNVAANKAIEYDKAHYLYLLSMIIWPSVLLSLVIISITLSAFTIYQSYKKHNFGQISWGGIFIIQLSAFFAGINIFYFFFNRGAAIATDLPGTLFSIIVMFLYMPIWYFANRVSRIRKLFLLSARMERLKSDPNYQNMQQQMQQFMNNPNNKSPFGFGNNNMNKNPNTQPVNSNTTNKTNNNQVPNTINNIDDTKPQVSETDKALAKLKRSELNKLAKILYISGYETMTRQELILSIKKATDK